MTYLLKSFPFSESVKRLTSLGPSQKEGWERSPTQEESKGHQSLPWTIGPCDTRRSHHWPGAKFRAPSWTPSFFFSSYYWYSKFRRCPCWEWSSTTLGSFCYDHHSWGFDFRRSEVDGIRALVQNEDHQYYAKGGWPDVLKGRSQYLMISYFTCSLIFRPLTFPMLCLRRPFEWLVATSSWNSSEAALTTKITALKT